LGKDWFKYFYSAQHRQVLFVNVNAYENANIAHSFIMLIIGLIWAVPKDDPA